MMSRRCVFKCTDGIDIRDIHGDYLTTLRYERLSKPCTTAAYIEHPLS